MKRKKLLTSVSVISVVVILIIIVLVSFRGILSNKLSKKEILSLVITHEEMLKSVVVEINESQSDIQYISTTQKAKISDPEYVKLKGLYTIINSIYRRINNEVFSKAMKIKGLRSISVGSSIVEFHCGGSGFGSAGSNYGFFYTEEENIIDDMGLVREGNGWLTREENGDNWYYTERITENFYYYEAHY